MYYDIKNFEGENNDIIEIVSYDAALGILKKSGNKNIKVYLPLFLSIGKLDNIDSYNRSNIHKYIKSDESFDFKDDIKKLKEIANNVSKIRVWSSHLDTDEYCLLLFICNLFKDKKISVTFSEEISWEAYSIGTITDKEIPLLEKREHILSEYEKEKYINEWNEIKRQNKELRYMINGKIISSDIDTFDNEIINRLKKMGKIYILKLVSDLIIDPIIPNTRYIDWIYIYLIERLERKGIIKSDIIDNKKYIELINNRR